MSANDHHMNLLLGTVYWGSTEDGFRIDEHDLTAGNLHLHADRIRSGVANRRCLYHDARAGLTGAMIGYLSNTIEIQLGLGLRDVDDLAAAVQLFHRTGIDFLNDLEGVFTIFLWDHESQVGYVVQDEYGSNLPLYYRQNKELHFSTSLKHLLARNPCKRSLNWAAVSDFLYHRWMVPNEMTLVEGVSKLIPGQYLTIDAHRRSVQVDTFKRHTKKVSREFAKANIIKCVENRVESLLHEIPAKRIACTLSGGFDSTLLLHILASKANSTEITAVTVGGQRINEIPEARRTAAFYPCVIHKCELIGDHGLDWLPDIVWRLEGYVFDEGIFLQYAMGRVVANADLETIFLGEGADQQLDRHRFSLSSRIQHNLKQTLRATPVADVYYRFIKNDPHRRLLRRFRRRNSAVLEDPFLDWVLKKNGIMLNSFLIQGVLPFLSRELRALSEALGRLNAQKKFYRNEMVKALGKERTNHLVKIGGSTDIEYLMRDRLPMLFDILEARFLNDILTSQEIDRIRTRPENYYGFILRLLYLHVFNELFISGKFDSLYPQPGLSLSLSDLLENRAADALHRSWGDRHQSRQD